MKKIPLSCVVVGTASILLSFIGIFFPLDGFRVFNLPFYFLIISLRFGATVVTKINIFVDFLSNPLFDLMLSVILSISGIGIIFLKPWGKKFAYIYAMSMVLFSVISVLIAIIGYVNAFIRISNNPSFMDGIIWGGTLVYILSLLGALLYPIILLIFFSRPKIREKFAVK